MNWEYVIAGYAIATVTFGGYGLWVRQRARRLQRTLAVGDGE
jgi:hypothetical protein